VNLSRVRQWRDRIPGLQGRFARDTSALVVGVIASQAIGLLAAPALTRLYTPDEFGVLAAFSSLVITGAVVVCWSYEAAVVLPRTDREARAVVWLCLIATVVSTALLGLLLALRGPALAQRLNQPTLEPWLFLAPVMLAALGAFQAYNYWCTRTRAFTAVGASRVVQAISTSGFQLTGSGPGGLIGGFVGGQVASTLVAWAAARRPRVEVGSWKTVVTEAMRAGSRYRQFPLFASWGSLLATSTYHIVPLVLSASQGAAAAGLYYLVLRVASIPMSLVGSAMAQVTLQRAAARVSESQSVAPLVEQVLGLLIRFGTVPFLLLAWAAPSGFRWVFGEEWYESGRFLRMMSPLFFMQFLTSPVSAVLIALERQRLAAVLQAAMFAGALIGLVGGAGVRDSAGGALAGYTGVVTVIYASYLVVICRLTGVRAARVWRVVRSGQAPDL
jgi:O-antigen/teichoic acid export membrane protein